ncbi:hypothetical protein, partial [Thiolapillus sp.]|uniref:hypothetical protein n=1 Tax=Thiolapillus sp. TaxID=2017437 RepID=UPI003AF5B31A
MLDEYIAYLVAQSDGRDKQVNIWFRMPLLGAIRALIRYNNIITDYIWLTLPGDFHGEIRPGTCTDTGAAKTPLPGYPAAPASREKYRDNADQFQT